MRESVPTQKLAPGAVLSLQALEDLHGQPVQVPDPALRIHLQLRRFAGCPVCNLHLQSFARRHAELTRAGIREVVAFHSSAEVLRAHAGGFPFAVIADPAKRLYAALGAEAAPRALLDPRAWWPILRAVLHGLLSLLRKGGCGALAARGPTSLGPG